MSFRDNPITANIARGISEAFYGRAAAAPTRDELAGFRFGVLTGLRLALEIMTVEEQRAMAANSSTDED